MVKFAYTFISLVFAFAFLTAPATAQSFGFEVAFASKIAANTPPQSVTPVSNPAPATFDNAKRAGSVSLMSNREFWLSAIILLFGIVIIVIEFFLLKDMVRDKTEEIARIYTVTLIIIGTLVLISSGFTNEQIAPALGLFGTIAGYLLGRSDFKASNKDDRS